MQKCVYVSLKIVRAKQVQIRFLHVLCAVGRVIKQVWIIVNKRYEKMNRFQVKFLANFSSSKAPDMKTKI